MFGGMDSELVGLYIKGEFSVESAISKNELVWEGTKTWFFPMDAASHLLHGPEEARRSWLSPSTITAVYTFCPQGEALCALSCGAE